LIPAIVQDIRTGEVLMLAYMNDEAIKKTIETGRAHYWSRSRKKLWLKGESSGHFQIVREMRIDCDEDAILLLVEQEGGACHTGYDSCFYRTINGKVIGKKVFEPQEVYGGQ
jgi:phosphoribosyl-AMP cyclohydrolase